ncbi:MAG TPA: hypothetical protein VEX68_25970 [Bryobacteraceae bacterium]|nr:hypothetical protein [Bryobacteraceae bacterium]
MRLHGVLLLLWVGAAVAEPQPPRLARLYPLGGQAGTTVSLEILGERLSNVTGVEFDCEDLVWKMMTFSSPHRLVGDVAISSSAALGLHTARVRTLDGSSNSGLINVTPFRNATEVEPNDKVDRATPISSFPVDIQGRLDKAPDIDIFSFKVGAGQRLVFDLKAIEDGSAVEARMLLLDGTGERIAFNDDRDDYNENPLIEHVFSVAGTYYLMLDQYRGPRGFNFGKLSAYTLRVGDIPVVASSYPRGIARGVDTILRIHGTGLNSIDSLYLTELRQAEYRRMTYPYTMPIRFAPDPPAIIRIGGEIKKRSPGEMEALFRIPDAARVGLWRLSLKGPGGEVHASTIEITDVPVFDEKTAESSAVAGKFLINGTLAASGEKDRYRIQVRARQPLQLWTVAEQIGVRHLDSVLTLRDANGKKLAENDDVVAGQGTLLGNPDSRVFFTPEQDGVVTVEVRDRTGRGGRGFEYCLKSDFARPSFQLFTTPENFTVVHGEAAEIKVHLVREAGFQGEVDVWVEGLPDGASGARGRFRADQLFEPNADGADMIIPEIALRIELPKSVALGRYSIRVRGAPTVEGDKRIVDAHATLMLGPLLDAWNFVRRPLPAITMNVVRQPAGRLSSKTRSVRLEQGKSAILELTAEDIPENASIQMLDLPNGVRSRIVSRGGSLITVAFEAEDRTATGTYEISAEADIGTRHVPSPSISLQIAAAK